MSAFPLAFEASPETDVIPVNDLVIGRATDGTIRGTANFAATFFNISRIDHFLTQAECDSVTAHYDGDRLSLHTMTVNGTAYSFRYVQRPRIVAHHGQYRSLRTDVYANL